jgi:hypothetical protein
VASAAGQRRVVEGSPTGARPREGLHEQVTVELPRISEEPLAEKASNFRWRNCVRKLPNV